MPGFAALPGCAGRSEPGVVLPAARRASTPGEQPRRGQDRGDVEIALGALTTGVAATLVVLGAFSFHRAQELEDYCGETRLTTIGDPCTDLLGFKPVRGARISGALEFALAVPIAVGGGLLLRKGIRLRRDWQKQQRGPSGLSLRPWLMGQPVQPGQPRQPRPQGVGLNLGFRF
ncbi:MAG: hypothetical protein H0T76_15855 [Nannocystis sp.]|nr:hypothetical protein [Nannocystis sp.]